MCQVNEKDIKKAFQYHKKNANTLNQIWFIIFFQIYVGIKYILYFPALMLQTYKLAYC